MVVDNGMSKAAIIKHIKRAAEKGDPFVFREPTPLTLANLNELVEDGKLVVAFAAYELPPKVVAPSRRIDVLGSLGYRWGIYKRPTKRHRWALHSRCGKTSGGISRPCIPQGSRCTKKVSGAFGLPPPARYPRFNTTRRVPPPRKRWKAFSSSSQKPPRYTCSYSKHSFQCGSPPRRADHMATQTCAHCDGGSGFGRESCDDGRGVRCPSCGEVICPSCRAFSGPNTCGSYADEDENKTDVLTSETTKHRRARIACARRATNASVLDARWPFYN